MGRITRLPLRPWEQYFKSYHEIDVGLDTFPYGGHTTSMDSLWMGVPVITLIGHTAVGRAGWSQLSNIGLQDLAADDEERFVKIAVELASDLPRLSRIRSELRGRMLSSPLTDSLRFAKNVEAAFRKMWIDWCASSDGK
jgi:protein O-GlcNAc transferase